MGDSGGWRSPTRCDESLVVVSLDDEVEVKTT
jgi:hypothetical protein